MAGTYSELKQLINQDINTNGNQEITGKVLNSVLTQIVTEFGAHATFVGFADPNTHPGTYDENVFFIATVPGQYANFGNKTLPKGKIAAFINSSGTWQMILSSVVGAMTTDGGEVFNDYTDNNANGQYAHAEGFKTNAEGNSAHSEGYNTQATGDQSHAEGRDTMATGNQSHTEGRDTRATGYQSHAEGYNTQATGNQSHAEGYDTVASGFSSHAEGRDTRATGDQSHAEGRRTEASGARSHAGGTNTEASGNYAFAHGVYAVAPNYAQVSIGTYNEKDSSPSKTSYITTKPAFVIGNGTSDTVRSDAFKILGNGTVYADNTTIQPMADYAEMFEWADGNLDEEDRIGYFVALQGNKIKKATGADEEYILGIISGTAAIIGDAPMRWNDKYLTDEWGRPIYETIQFTEIVLQPKLDDDGNTVYDDDGNPVSEEVEIQKQAYVRKVNPEYNPGQEYIPREQRPEWGVVGLLGKVLVRQDGTLAAGGFCKPNSEGIATLADSGYYVLEVKNGTQARVLVK